MYFLMLPIFWRMFLKKTQGCIYTCIVGVHAVLWCSLIRKDTPLCNKFSKELNLRAPRTHIRMKQLTWEMNTHRTENNWSVKVFWVRLSSFDQLNLIYEPRSNSTKRKINHHKGKENWNKSNAIVEPTRPLYKEKKIWWDTFISNPWCAVDKLWNMPKSELEKQRAILYFKAHSGFIKSMHTPYIVGVPLIYHLKRHVTPKSGCVLPPKFLSFWTLTVTVKIPFYIKFPSATSSLFISVTSFLFDIFLY